MFSIRARWRRLSSPKIQAHTRSGAGGGWPRACAVGVRRWAAGAQALALGLCMASPAAAQSETLGARRPPVYAGYVSEAAPAPTVSTAREVAPPADPNEPLFRDVPLVEAAPPRAGADLRGAQASAASPTSSEASPRSAIQPNEKARRAHPKSRAPAPSAAARVNKAAARAPAVHAERRAHKTRLARKDGAGKTQVSVNKALGKKAPGSSRDASARVAGKRVASKAASAKQAAGKRVATQRTASKKIRSAPSAGVTTTGQRTARRTTHRMTERAARQRKLAQQRPAPLAAQQAARPSASRSRPTKLAAARTSANSAEP